MTVVDEPEQDHRDGAEFAATWLVDVTSAIAASRTQAAEDGFAVVQTVVLGITTIGELLAVDEDDIAEVAPSVQLLDLLAALGAALDQVAMRSVTPGQLRAAARHGR